MRRLDHVRALPEHRLGHRRACDLGAAGGIFPLAFGIIRDTFPPLRVAGAIGLLSAVFGVGGGIGLPMSGILAEHAGVPWLFWSGDIIAFPAMVGVALLVPRSPRIPGGEGRLDGGGLLSLSLVLLLLGVTEANSWGWGSPKTIALLLGGVVVLGIWLQVERVVEEPLIDLRLLRLRAVRPRTSRRSSSASRCSPRSRSSRASCRRR